MENLIIDIQNEYLPLYNGRADFRYPVFGGISCLKWITLLSAISFLLIFPYHPLNQLQYTPDLSPIPEYNQRVRRTTLKEFIGAWPMKTCYQPSLSDKLASFDPNCPRNEVKQDPPWDGEKFRDNFLFKIQPNCVDYDYQHLVVYIYSRAYNFKERKTLRLQLAQQLGKSLGARFKILFIVGVPDDLHYIKEAEDYLLQEVALFQDILRPDVEENYHKLAYKGFSVIQWLAKCSKHTPFFMKMDDDLPFNMTAVFNLLQNIPCNYSHSLMCYKPIRNIVIRLPHKSMVLKVEYPLSWYPGGCWGHGYIMTRQVAFRLYDVGKQMGKIFKIDDMFFSALLRRKACVSRSHFHLDNGTVNNIRFGN